MNAPARTIRRSSLPATAGSQLPAQLRPFISALTEIIETGEGNRGDSLDRKLTVRDLIASGAFKLRDGWRPGNPGGLVPVPDVPDRAIPPAPGGFQGVGGFGMVTLIWNDPRVRYRNHSLTNIYRSEKDNFGQATLISRDTGMIYTDTLRMDAVDPDDPKKALGYYYWISWVSTSGIEGPPNSAAGIYIEPLLDTTYLLELIGKALDDTELSKILAESLDLGRYDTAFDDLQARVETARLLTSAEALLRDDQDVVIKRRVDTLEVSVQKNISASIGRLEEVMASDRQAIARTVETLQAGIDENASSLVEERTARTTNEQSVVQFLTGLNARMDNGEAAVLSLSSAVTDQFEAAAQQLVLMKTQFDDMSASYINDRKVITTQFEAVSSEITAVKASFEGQAAAVQQTLSVHGDALNGLSAQATLKLDVNGYVGGIGAYNNGRVIDVAILADNFWIASPKKAGQDNSVIKPFAIVDDEVWINSARIRTASIQSGQLGPISIGKLYSLEGQPITTVSGRLIADALDTDSLVAVLARINTAYIDAAQIKVAAIRNAHIADANIDTLKLKGESVTIPRSYSRPELVTGGNLAGVQFDAPEAMYVLVMFSTLPSYVIVNSSEVTAHLVLKANDVTLVNQATTTNSSLGMSYSTSALVKVNAGANQFVASVGSSNNMVGYKASSITVLGVLR
ncbi:DUF1983 domain-containing protein [Pseudomonas costantinii]|uniref:phage tail tip fiber protein n=1 Tax=Pseudomonas costantinii TaxID=168469 RepID=UPI0015A3D685|nr:DUF1983 domain-containing protein [Pseudomonas costantinii]NVZ22638.1 DUF1983 domain-containing protein [Pseudomonas costantinii]